MSDLGKALRLGRIFNHPSGRILSVAVDHMINYPTGMPEPLRDIGPTIEGVVAGRPSAITMNKGIAQRYGALCAGKVPLIVQSMVLRAGESAHAATVDVEEAVAMGADAIAVAMFVKGEDEVSYLAHLADVVREASLWGLPVIPHIYPLSSGDEQTSITHEPEDIFYAVRAGIEMGADVIKVPYTGDIASFRDIVSPSPVPVVSAGGPKCETLDDAVAMVRDVVRAGAQGATMGRNVWGFPDIPAAVQRLKETVFETEVDA